MPNTAVPITTGAGINMDTQTMPNGDHRQRLVRGDYGGYEGRASTWRTQGSGIGTRSPLFALWNPAGNSINVDVKKMKMDMISTVVKVVGTVSPIVRLHRLTAAPTNGNAMTKVSMDSTATPNANVVLVQSSTADGGAPGTLVITSAGIITEEYAPRTMATTGYTMACEVTFLTSGHVTCRPGEGVAVTLDYPAAAGNPNTDFWIANISWEEYVE